MTTDGKLRTTPPQDRTAGTVSLVRAWVAVALVAPAFLLAFGLVEVLYALLGYAPEDATEPLWVALVANVPGILLFLVPCAAAVRYGHRAWVQGRSAGLLPAALGGVLGTWMVVLGIVTLVAGL